MSTNHALNILKAFYYGAQSMEDISRKTKASREEVREVLRNARTCGLISYSTHDYAEVFVRPNKKGLEKYLRTKGAIK